MALLANPKEGRKGGPTYPMVLTALFGIAIGLGGDETAVPIAAARNMTPWHETLKRPTPGMNANKTTAAAA